MSFLDRKPKNEKTVIYAIDFTRRKLVGKCVIDHVAKTELWDMRDTPEALEIATRKRRRG